MSDSFQPCAKVGEGCCGERVKDQHGSVLERRESFLNREDRDNCFEQDLTLWYLEKNFSPGQMGGITQDNRQVPCGEIAASHPKEHLPACRGDCSWERSRAARGQTIPCPEQDTRDSYVPEQPAQGGGFPCSQSLRMDTGLGPGSAPVPAGPTPLGHHHSQAILGALKLMTTLDWTTSGLFIPKAFSL